MKAPMAEAEVLRWLKDSADSEPELPAQITDRLWARLSRDLGTGIVYAGAATSGAHVAATASAPVPRSVTSGASELAAAGVGAGSQVAATGANSVSGLWKSVVVARFAVWSAPALVLGAAAGAIGHASLATVKGWTGDADRIASAPEVSNDDAPAATSTLEGDGAGGEIPRADAHRNSTAPATAASGGALGPSASNGATTTASSRVTPATASGGGVPPESALTRERAVLDKARGELAAGEPARALAHVQRHARLFPGGILSEEREAIAINALVRMGDYSAATKRAAAFRARFPQSLLTHSVEAAVAAAK